MNETNEVNQSSEKFRYYRESGLISTKENSVYKGQQDPVGDNLNQGQLCGSLAVMEYLRTPDFDLNFLAPVAAALFDSTRNGVMVTDFKGRIQLVNPAFSQLTGFSPLDIIGRQPQTVLLEFEDEAFNDTVWEQINMLDYWQGEVRSRRKNGEISPQMLSINAIKNKLLKISHCVWIFSDITLLKDTVTRLDFWPTMIR